MTLNEIERTLRELRLSGIATTLSTRVMQAQTSQQPFLETLASMLQDELDRRRSRSTERRFKHSRLDERLTLADFDWRFNPKLPRQACFELNTLKFIGDGANALIVGRPGTGKSHVAKAVPASRPLRLLRAHDGSDSHPSCGCCGTPRRSDRRRGEGRPGSWPWRPSRRRTSACP
jgi:hypothetical protein